MVSAVPFFCEENNGLKEYLKAQSKTNEIVIDNTVSSDELDRFSKVEK